MKTKLKKIPGALWILLGFSFICSPGEGLNAQADLAAILSDGDLWGKDFYQALSHVKAWERIDEQEIAIFPTVVASSTFYKDKNLINRNIAAINKALKERPSKFQPRFKTALKKPQATPLTFEVSSFDLPQDSTIQIRFAGPSLQFLSPELTLKMIQNKYGEPEETTQEMTNAGRGHRPMILTRYHYAGGAIKFVTMNWDPDPEKINRVLLDVQKASDSIYR